MIKACMNALLNLTYIYMMRKNYLETTTKKLYELSPETKFNKNCLVYKINTNFISCYFQLVDF